MTDCYKTTREAFAEVQQKAFKYECLIEQLKEDNEKDRKTVQYYEEAYRNSKSEHDKKSYKRTIYILNAKRELRREILVNDHKKM